MLSGNAALKKHKGAMVLPAVALYRALTASGADAEDLLNAYGDAMGKRFAGIVHCITSVPGRSGRFRADLAACGQHYGSHERRKPRLSAPDRIRTA